MASIKTVSGKALKERIEDALVHRIGKDTQAALPHDWLAATIYTLRDDIIERWMVSSKAANAAMLAAYFIPQTFNFNFIYKRLAFYFMGLPIL